MLRDEEIKELKDIQAKIERHRRSGSGPDWRLEGQLLLAAHQSLVQGIFWRLWLEQQFGKRSIKRISRELEEHIAERRRQRFGENEEEDLD